MMPVTIQRQDALVVGVAEFQWGSTHSFVLRRAAEQHLGLNLHASQNGLLVVSIDKDSVMFLHNASNPNNFLRVGDCIFCVNGETMQVGMQVALQRDTELRLEFRRTLRPLKAVPVEVGEVDRICRDAGIRVTKLVNKQVTKESMVQNMQQAHSIVHFATHGLLEYPALVLHGDSSEAALFTAHEIHTMRVQAHLVVLSACNTGRGHTGSDGVMGLARAFAVAGARNVLVTLWATPDSSTSVFMAHLYDFWCIEKQPLHIALQSALCKIITARWGIGGVSDPLYLPEQWAQFAL